MAGRAFCVKIQLDVHAVTCPGVWLCPNGKVALRINTLNSCTESRRISPIFPLLLHDKFTFSKIFTRIVSLTELQHTLEREFLYAELIQWITPVGRGIVLATFEINLADLLYPAPCFKGLLAGVDVDLLMEPTKCFPGIIAPKIEVSTKTVVEEIGLSSYDTSTSKRYVVNPKMINSKQTTCGEKRRSIKGIIRQRKVCHTKPRSQSCCPYRQRSNSLDDSHEWYPCTANHRIRSRIDQCYHSGRKEPTYASRSDLQKPVICDNIHVMENCPVCSKYNCYFSKYYDDMDTVRKSTDYKRRYAGRYHRKLSDEYCCTCRSDSTCDTLQSKIRNLQGTDNKLETVADDVVECIPSCEFTRDHSNQGFYKNLEKFYKRMYKQAKICAQEVEG